MMDITAPSSSTDAHECPEAPILAANTDLLILPRQNLIWCTLDRTFALHRMRHCLSAGFLGRMCLSGDILTLDTPQWDMVEQSLAFYELAKPILEDCTVQVFQQFLDESVRYPRGIQAVLMTGRNGKALLVCHSFSDSAGCSLRLPCRFTQVEHVFGPAEYCTQSENQLHIANLPEFEAFSLILSSGAEPKLPPLRTADQWISSHRSSSTQAPVLPDLA